MRWWFGTRESHATGLRGGGRALSAGIARGRRAALPAPPEASRNPAQEICRTFLAVLQARPLVDHCCCLRHNVCFFCWAFLTVLAPGSASETRPDRADGQPYRQPRSRPPTIPARPPPKRAAHPARCAAKPARATPLGRNRERSTHSSEPYPC